MNLTNDTALPYLLAGNAIVTITSTRTGVHYTYRIHQPDDTSPHFVSVLTGPNNTSDYAFIGTIFDRSVYRHGKKSHISAAAPSAIAFSWAWKHIVACRIPDSLVIQHSNTCGRCGRTLTDPDSLALGLGPICRAAI